MIHLDSNEIGKKTKKMSHGLYLHIPFCERKCFYCGFSVVVGAEHHMDAYLDALLKEARLFQGQRVSSVYIGGGTPSLLSGPQIERLMEIVKDCFFVEEKAEITFEANPESLDGSRLEALCAAGVNRLSLGFQTFHERWLHFLGRTHRPEDNEKAFRLARGAGLRNISCDLMFGFPGETESEMEKDIQTLVGLKPDHVSIYSLTIEPQSRFFVEKKRAVDADQSAVQYETVRDRLTRDGFPQYEVSNFSQKGFESSHNKNYWQGGNYIGLGCGAHSHLDGRRWWNEPRFYAYMECDRQKKSPIVGEERLTPEQRLTESLVFGLRMTSGVDLNRLEQTFSVRLSDERKKTIEELIQKGFMETEGLQLRTTPTGLMVLDEISGRLI